MRTVGWIVTLFFSCWVGSDCVAQKITGCEQYAHTAIAQFNQKNSSGCNVSGPEWHGNYDNHLKWCRGVGQPALWQSETDKRASTLARCQSGPDAQACRIYTQSAIDQYNENVSRKCGLNDQHWHKNYGQHYNWCLNVLQSQRESEMKFRANGLAACGAAQRYCPWCP